MSDIPTSSAELFNEVVRDAVTSVLKPAGFRKADTNFHRRKSACVQVVNIQSSQSSSSQEKRFYVNVGVAFDDICRLKSMPILETPKESECDARGTRARLEQFVLTAAPRWEIGNSVDAARMTPQLHRAVVELVLELDRIDGIAAYRAHPWFDRARPKQENAQILYLLGDRAGALNEVEELAKRFVDRMNANRADWWVEHLGLKELA